MNNTDKLADVTKKRFRMQLIRSVLIYSVVMIALVILVQSILSQFVWYGNNPMYWFLKKIKNNFSFMVLLALVIGYLVIFIYYWNNLINNLNNIVIATQELYTSEEYIKLDENLKEVEVRLNEIKLTSQKNQKIAQEAEQRKNDLIVYLAHDLKTPLTSVLGYLTLLVDENNISDKTRQKYLGIALNKTEHLEDLINDFFEITRFNLSSMSLNISNIDLSLMIDQLVYEFSNSFVQKAISYRLELTEKIMIDADSDKLQRAFENLLINACNYSYDNSEIKIVLKRIDNKISLRVINSAPTIPKDRLERIFEQFYRIDSSRANKNGGAGLGLAITKEIVEAHKGSISVRSQDNLIDFEIIL